MNYWHSIITIKQSYLSASICSTSVTGGLKSKYLLKTNWSIKDIGNRIIVFPMKNPIAGLPHRGPGGGGFK